MSPSRVMATRCSLTRPSSSTRAVRTEPTGPSTSTRPARTSTDLPSIETCAAAGRTSSQKLFGAGGSETETDATAGGGSGGVTLGTGTGAAAVAWLSEERAGRSATVHAAAPANAAAPNTIGSDKRRGRAGAVLVTTGVPDGGVGPIITVSGNDR